MGESKHEMVRLRLYCKLCSPFMSIHVQSNSEFSFFSFSYSRSFAPSHWHSDWLSIVASRLLYLQAVSVSKTWNHVAAGEWFKENGYCYSIAIADYKTKHQYGSSISGFDESELSRCVFTARHNTNSLDRASISTGSFYDKLGCSFNLTIYINNAPFIQIPQHGCFLYGSNKGVGSLSILVIDGLL